jgi:plastocyanin
MPKKIIAVFLLLALLSVLAVACTNGSTGSSGYGSTGSSDQNASSTSAVHLAASDFAQPSITIAKGSKLTLINDTSTVHNIQNGSWVDNEAKPLKEKDAPTVQTQFNGNDTQMVGPFPVAGTYHLYCTIHAGMNLTVIVQ